METKLMHAAERLLHTAYRADLVADDKILLEIKAVSELLPIHEAQLLTYCASAAFESVFLSTSTFES